MDTWTMSDRGIRGGPDRYYIAAALDMNAYDKDAELGANARLIAAAPEMADLLHRLTEHFKNNDSPLGVQASALLAHTEKK